MCCERASDDVVLKKEQRLSAYRDVYTTTCLFSNLVSVSLDLVYLDPFHGSVN